MCRKLIIFTFCDHWLVKYSDTHFSNNAIQCKQQNFTSLLGELRWISRHLTRYWPKSRETRTEPSTHTPIGTRTLDPHLHTQNAQGPFTQPMQLPTQNATTKVILYYDKTEEWQVWHQIYPPTARYYQYIWQLIVMRKMQRSQRFKTKTTTLTQWHCLISSCSSKKLTRPARWRLVTIWEQFCWSPHNVIFDLMQSFPLSCLLLQKS